MSTAMARGWLAALVALLALLMVAPGAWAHSALVSSDPEDGAVLAQAPGAVSFTFNEDLLAQGNAITLTEVASGARLPVGPVTAEGRSVQVAWPDQSPAGEFRAAYRVVSADGHPISGSITFTVGAAAGEPGDAATTGSQGTAPSASPPQVSQASPSAVAAPGTVADETSGGGGLLLWVLALGAVIVVAALAGTWVMRRTR